MTPKPSKKDMKLRRILDLDEGVGHLVDIIGMAKDGKGAQDHLSDHHIGMLLLAKDLKLIKAWEVQVFQMSFVKGGVERKRYWHFGKPFLGPDAKILTISGRHLRGDGSHEYDDSDLDDIDTLKAHPGYKKWLKEVLYAGLDATSTSYARTSTNLNSIKDCDDNVNSKAYASTPWARVLIEAEKALIDKNESWGTRRAGPGKSISKARTKIAKSKSRVTDSDADDEDAEDDGSDDGAEQEDEEEEASTKAKKIKSNATTADVELGSDFGSGNRLRQIIHEDQAHDGGVSLVDHLQTGAEESDHETWFREGGEWE